jgi:hypothetical protein
MAGPFRVSKARTVGDPTRGPGMPEYQDYLQRLMKMIPADVVGLYLVAAGLIDPNDALLLACWTVFCAICVVLVRAMGSKDPGSSDHPGPDWMLVTMSTIAFLIWVYDIGGPFAAYGIPNRPYGSLAVMAWTFLVPYFYRGI